MIQCAVYTFQFLINYVDVEARWKTTNFVHFDVKMTHLATIILINVYDN